MMRLAFILATLAACAFGYIRNASSSGVPLIRSDFGAARIWINNQIIAGQGPIAPGSDPVGAARAALDSWNNVRSSAARFMPLVSTSAGRNPSDNLSVISIADMSDPSAASALNGAVAITICDYIMNPAGSPDSRIMDSDILLNPQVTFSTTGAGGTYDLQSVLTHELGHALGADHTGILGASMFQSAYPNQRLLSADDISFVSAVYPAAGAPAMGNVHGKVSLSSGALSSGFGAAAALITLVDTTQGITVGGMAAKDGAYSIAVPAGNYTVYAEPLGGIVGPANITSLVAYDGAVFSPAVFEPAIARQAAAVSAGGSSQADITAISGATPLQISYAAVVPADGAIAEVISFSGPVMVNSGQTVDLVLLGPGIDETMNLNALGAGIHVLSVRRDSAVAFGGSLAGLPVIRATLQIDRQTSASLASLFITKGRNTVSYSGILFVTPPVPVFDASAVVSSGDFQGGGISPGGLYTIFASPGAANLGPATGVVNTGLDSYGKLPSTLAGVSVTFDGIPAPLFYVRQDLINVQVPFEVAAALGSSKSATMIVNFDGAASEPVQVPVLRSQPAIFTLASDGRADSIVIDQGGRLNSATAPAAKGSYVVIYGAGIGDPGCAGYDLETGAPAPAPPAGCTGQYTASIGGHAAVPVAFAGWTPTLVGLAQWNLRIPADSPSGAVTFTLTDTATGATTQPGTLYIQ